MTLEVIGDNFYLEQYKAIKASENWFKNFKFLGKGGNGTAFLVMGTGGPLRGGIFALKVFHKMSSPKRRERFLQEALFLREANHPNLMRLLDEGTFAERPFVVQDFMPKTMHSELGNGQLDFGKSLLFSCQLLSALQALHKQNIIHRDIKPQNIFIDNLTAYLGDFGLIKKIEPEVDSEDLVDFEGYFAMPRFYRTPELISYAKQESNLDLRSDIFQLGLVFAQMYTGRNPLVTSENLLEPIQLEKLSNIPGKHSGLVASIINQMLDTNKETRCTIDSALSRFTGLIENYSKDYEQLHGRFFV